MTGVGQAVNMIHGKAFSGVVGLFTDNDPADSAYTTNSYTASIDWGDGTTSAGTLTSIGTNTYSVSAGTKTFSLANSYDTTITIKGPGTLAWLPFP